MPHRPGEYCEKCHKHMHPQTAAASLALLSHPLSACSLCLPPGQILLTCGGCKFARYCGKACQKSHRPVHKAACEANIRIREMAKAYGPEIAAKQISFADWCENKSQAFAHAAFAALEMFSPSDGRKAYEYVFFVAVGTEVIPSEANKLKFTHSILLAGKQSRQAIHDKFDERGGPEAVEEWLLPGDSILRIILQNIGLPPPINLHTLTFNCDLEKEKLFHKHDPNWLEHLKMNVKYSIP